MLLDALTTLSSTQDLSGQTGSIPSTNTLDLSVQRDIGVSWEPIMVTWTTLPVAAAGTTINVALQTSPDNSNWTTIEESSPQLISSYNGQNAFAFRSSVPVGTKRYLRMLYTVSAALTTGAVTTGIGVEYSAHVYYGKNYVA